MAIDETRRVRVIPRPAALIRSVRDWIREAWRSGDVLLALVMMDFPPAVTAEVLAEVLEEGRIRSETRTGLQQMTKFLGAQPPARRSGFE
jgi:hypothetical protein